ncbi:hypothetical protein [Paenibacillus turpanensis]|uniref:hypothetical protein n=1 Tax=Paenibacillus turpanensis TaxID=2689078 RepID=UPI00140B9A69
MKKVDRFTIIIEKNNKRMIAKAPLSGVNRLVFIINRQYTNSPNTTQISSGAGRSSAAGNNAAINSPYTRQQQSVGANGTAKNKSTKGSRSGSTTFMKRKRRTNKEIVIMINDQIVKLPKGSRNASATQVASGGGTYSTGGTNSAIESLGTRQQHAVGGGGTALNKYTGKRRTRKTRA